MAGKEEGARSFAHFVQHVGEGEPHAEISEQLHELVKSLQSESVGGDRVVKGSLTLTFNLTMKPSGFVEVKHDVKVKKPTRVRTEAVMYVTAGGNLALENQKQQGLPFREVGGKGDAPREAAGKTEV
jgi:hypothetical protein